MFGKAKTERTDTRYNRDQKPVAQQFARYLALDLVCKEFRER
jgi:hypothetical protein